MSRDDPTDDAEGVPGDGRGTGVSSDQNTAVTDAGPASDGRSQRDTGRHGESGSHHVDSVDDLLDRSTDEAGDNSTGEHRSTGNGGDDDEQPTTRDDEQSTTRDDEQSTVRDDEQSTTSTDGVGIDSGYTPDSRSRSDTAVDLDVGDVLGDDEDE